MTSPLLPGPAAGPYFVAAMALDGDPGAQTAALAGALGLTLYEARERARPPAPRIIASLAEAGAAAELVAVLAPAGLAPLVFSRSAVPDEASRFLVRSFTIHEAGLRLEDRAGARLALRFDRVHLLLQGMASHLDVEKETTTRRKLAIGKALATGGMAMTKKEKTTKTRIHETGGAFLLVHAQGLPVLEFRESELQYQGLGAALQPGSTANFQRVCALLRGLPGEPTWDGRLMTVAGQRHLLGHVLTPARDLDVAQALLARWHGPREAG